MSDNSDLSFWGAPAELAAVTHTRKTKTRWLGSLVVTARGNGSLDRMGCSADRLSGPNLEEERT
jgi:hypothetical protein